MKRGLDQEEPSMTFHTGKAKLIWKEVKEEEEDEQHEKKEAERRRDLPTVFGGGGGMDELLAVLGYKVRSSEMADVAEKLEQLEMVMGSAAQEDGASNLYNDTVHYNPSDLSSWVENMLSEFNDPLITQSQTGVRNSVYEDDSEYDLRAIPGIAANYPSPPPPPQNSSENQPSKRFKSSTEFSPPKALVPPYSEPSRSVVVIDTQEAGVRLVHTLMACAEAVQQDNLKLADALIKQIGLLAASQAGAMRKVATYFAEALARRVYRIFPQGGLEFDTAYCDALQMHFYESCPYLKFAHFTANQLILGSFNSTSKNRVHVIDFGLKQGMQWPALMQALALRPGGPPVFRLTAISPPQLDNSDGLQQVGWKLAQFADTLGIEFEFRGLICNSLADIEPVLLNIGRPEIETAAVNSVLELHRFLAHPSSIEKVLCLIKAMRPKIVTIVEQEGNHNGPVFVERFNEALNYYSNLFDSLEVVGPPNQDVLMSEVYLGRQICNVVACEGVDRVERHETLAQWQVRLGSAGFDPVHIGSNGFKQASTLLALFAGREGYGVEERNGCLMLTWHTRPLIAMSAWQPGGCGGDGETQ